MARVAEEGRMADFRYKTYQDMKAANHRYEVDRHEAFERYKVEASGHLQIELLKLYLASGKLPNQLSNQDLKKADIQMSGTNVSHTYRRSNLHNNDDRSSVESKSDNGTSSAESQYENPQKRSTWQKIFRKKRK